MFAYRMFYDELTSERQIEQSDKEKIQHLQQQLDQEKICHEKKIQLLQKKLEDYKLAKCSSRSLP